MRVVGSGEADQDEKPMMIFKSKVELVSVESV